MKYLSSRTEYLKSANYKVINENVAGAGPFANDIAWGDSLLGRMLHSFARKAQIGIDLVRMDDVIKCIKNQFNYLLDVCKLNGGEIDEVTKNEIDMIQMSILLGTLIKTINESESTKDGLDEVLKSTKKTIYEVIEYTLQTDKSESDREELLDKLNEFLSELKKLEEGKNIQVQSQGGKEKSNSEPYHLYMANLKSITDILNAYDMIKSKMKSDNDKNINVENPKSKLIDDASSKSIDNEFKKRIDDWKEEQRKLGKNTNPGEGTRSRIKREVEEFFNKRESFTFENSGDGSKIKTGGDNTILKATRSLYDYIMNDPGNKKELEELVRSGGDKNSQKDNFLKGGKLSSIKRMYDYIKINSVSENLDNLLSRSEELGKKIKELYNVSKSGDFNSIPDVLKNPLTSFNKTMSDILSYKPESKEVKTESRLLKYDGFRKVFESDDNDQNDVVETTEPKSDDSKYDTSIPWNKIFSAEYLRKWVVTEELEKKVNQKLEKIEKEGDRYVIKGIDPILEIVKIFNRAYKLHTSQTIPTARSGGKVSNRKFREYQYIGTGSGPSANDSGSGFKVGMGPYRNIKIFDKWEDTVLDIIKDSKYQVLFNENTIIQVGEADERVNVSGEKSGRVEGGGKVLLKFINDMLDGDTLYKGEDGRAGGAQKKFIQKYFNVEVDSNQLGYGKDVEVNSGVANETKNPTIVEFKKSDNVSNKDGCIFSVNGTHFMIVTDTDRDYVYVKYSETFGYIKEYIKAERVKSMKGDLSSLVDKVSNIHYARINTNHFEVKGDERLLKKGNNNLEFKSVDISEFIKDSQSSKSEDVKVGVINDLYKLVIKDSDKQYFLPTSSKQKLRSGDKGRGEYNQLKDILNK